MTFDFITTEFGYFNGFVLNIVKEETTWTLKQWDRDIINGVPMTDTPPSIVSMEPDVSLCLFSNGVNIWSIDSDWNVELIPDTYSSVRLLGFYQGSAIAQAINSVGEPGIVKYNRVRSDYFSS